MRADLTYEYAKKKRIEFSCWKHRDLWTDSTSGSIRLYKMKVWLYRWKSIGKRFARDGWERKLSRNWIHLHVHGRAFSITHNSCILSHRKSSLRFYRAILLRPPRRELKPRFYLNQRRPRARGYDMRAGKGRLFHPDRKRIDSRNNICENSYGVNTSLPF